MFMQTCSRKLLVVDLILLLNFLSQGMQPSKQALRTASMQMTSTLPHVVLLVYGLTPLCDLMCLLTATSLHVNKISTIESLRYSI